MFNFDVKYLNTPALKNTSWCDATYFLSFIALSVQKGDCDLCWFADLTQHASSKEYMRVSL
jgi:hypothetical protein